MKNDKNFVAHRVKAMIKDPYFGTVRDGNTQWVFSRSRFWSNLGACLLIYWLLLAIWVSVSGVGVNPGVKFPDWMLLTMVGIHHLVVVLFAVISAHVEVSK